MAYSGEVVPGGPADQRELPGVSIAKLSVSTMNNNCYLVTCLASREQVLIDAADDAAGLLAWQRDSGGHLGAVITTHQHWDHHRALADVVQATGARTLAGRDDASGLPIPVDQLLDHGDKVSVGDLVLEVVHLRGHTPGSVAVVLTAGDGSVHVFTGDSLFPGGPGRTTNPADFTSLMDDLEARVFEPLPDSTWIYPGHGNDSTIGTERPHLQEWRERGW